MYQVDESLQDILLEFYVNIFDASAQCIASERRCRENLNYKPYTECDKWL